MFNSYSKFDYPTALRWWLALVLICCAVTSIHAQETTETKSVGENTLTGTQPTASGKPTIRPIRTDSPRNTLKSFLRLRDELEQTLQSYRLNNKPGAKWSGHIGLSILNIYNQKNIIGEASNFEADGTEVFSYDYSIGFAPNLMVMIEW